MTTNPLQDLDKPGPEWMAMFSDWRLIRTLNDGTRAMRAAGQLYLPIEDGETDVAYRNRLERSVLYNFLRRTVKAVVGKPFSKPMNQSEDLSPWAVELCEDIDLNGNDVTVFCKQWFEDAVQMGISYVLVDYPKTTGEETRLQEKTNNIRPYWVLIEAEQVIGFRTINIDGVHYLQQVRIRQDTQEPEGRFSTVAVSRIRVYELILLETTGKPSHVVCEVYKLTKMQNGKEEWLLEEAPTVLKGLTEIPLVPLYTEQTGVMTADPPLIDLAYLNVAHWQSSSDMRNIIHVASVPILFGTGFPKDDSGQKQQIGPNRMITTTKEGATLAFVEHSGKAIEAGRTHLEDLKMEMSIIGMELIAKKRPGGVTATEITLDTAAADSALKSMVTSLNDAVETALYYTSLWVGEDLVGEVTANRDFCFSIFDIATPEWWLKAADKGMLTKRTILNEAKKAGLISEEVDIDEEIAKAKEEQADLLRLFENEGGDDGDAAATTGADGNDAPGDTVPKVEKQPADGQ